MQITIVALPEEQDLTNEVSSEKAAHMTLLFLGEVAFEQAKHIVDQVEHISQKLHRFYMDVDYRGELGPDNADVLFFKPNKHISEARDFMLKDETIRKAFDSNFQYPVWTPHLTLGYPDKPAKKLEAAYDRFYSVCFDRISVWTSDSDGPTFRLEAPNYTDEMTMSEGSHNSMASTIQDVVDSLTSVQKDAFALVLGAISEQDTSIDGDTEIGDSNLASVVSSFSFEQLIVLSFLAAGIESNVTHELADDGDYISHHGVKGMRWGVRRDRTSGGSDRVAQIKANGHKVLKATLGDKQFWKKAGLIGAVAAVGVGASFVAPAAFPTKTLTAMGLKMIGGPKNLDRPMFANGKLYNTPMSGPMNSTWYNRFGQGDLKSIASDYVQDIGITAVGVGTTAALTAAKAGNIVRAFGNHQNKGAYRVQNVLTKNGSKTPVVKHSDNGEIVGEKAVVRPKALTVQEILNRL